MRNMKIVSRTLVVFLVASALTACGFHLRGSTPLPDAINNIYVDADKGPFKEQMEDVLSYAGATVTTSSEAATSTLVVRKSVVEKTVGTLDESGKANSYDLKYVVNYTLLDAAGTVMRTSSLNENRRYDFDPDTVLETDSDEDELILDMEESIALRILRQLATVDAVPAAK